MVGEVRFGSGDGGRRRWRNGRRDGIEIWRRWRWSWREKARNENVLDGD